MGDGAVNNIHDAYRNRYLDLEDSAKHGRMSWEAAMASVAMLSIEYGKAVEREKAKQLAEEETLP